LFTVLLEGSGAEARLGESVPQRPNPNVYV